MTVNQFPDLPYSYDALEPYIDKETMEFHHTKHHKAYYTKFINAIKETELENKEVKDILSNLDQIPKNIKQKVIDQGGGFFNHNFFWQILTPNSKKAPEPLLSEEINKSFNSFEEFKQEFKQKAMGLFGSGWTWLVLDQENNLKIVITKNQDSPISEGLKPILSIDMWEHAFYLKYQNRKAEYLDNFWNIVNWSQAEHLFKSYKGL